MLVSIVSSSVIETIVNPFATSASEALKLKLPNSSVRTPCSVTSSKTPSPVLVPGEWRSWNVKALAKGPFCKLPLNWETPPPLPPVVLPPQADRARKAKGDTPKTRFRFEGLFAEEFFMVNLVFLIGQNINQFYLTIPTEMYQHEMSY